MFAGGFQALAFQTAANNNNYPGKPSSAGTSDFSYIYPYQKLLSERVQKEKINEIKASVSKNELEIEALKQRIITLGLEKRTSRAERINQELRELLAELQAQKAVLMRRLRNEEAILLLLVALKKRRLRAI